MLYRLVTSYLRKRDQGVKGYGVVRRGRSLEQLNAPFIADGAECT